MKQSQVQERETSTSLLLLAIVLAGIVFSILLEVATQLLPPHYNPISQPESDLAVGPYGFLMDINFALRGVLYLIFLVVFVKAIPKKGQSRSGLILVGISAIGKLIIAFAVTDLTPRPETIHGIIHTLAALISFFCSGLGVLLLSRSLRHVSHVRPSPRFLVGLATVTLIWSIIVVLTVVVSSKIGVWGVLERIYTLLFFLWIFIVSLGLWNYPSRDITPGQRSFPYSPGEPL